MGRKYQDLTGQKFGRLTVTEKKGVDKYRHTMWGCLCDCGNIVTVGARDLKGQKTKSCGCLHKEIVSLASTKHGQSGTRLYGIWAGMIQRCENPKNRYYKDYGGRGIAVCPEWHSAENFIKWAIENGYRDNLEIDRKDPNKNYEPSNCRWSTEKEQANNKRNSHLLTYDGKTQTLAQWADELGIKYNTLWARLNRSQWNIEKAIMKVKRGG